MQNSDTFIVKESKIKTLTKIALFILWIYITIAAIWEFFVNDFRDWEYLGFVGLIFPFVIRLLLDSLRHFNYRIEITKDKKITEFNKQEIISQIHFKKITYVGIGSASSFSINLPGAIDTKDIVPKISGITVENKEKSIVLHKWGNITKLLLFIKKLEPEVQISMEFFNKIPIRFQKLLFGKINKSHVIFLVLFGIPILLLALFFVYLIVGVIIHVP